MKSSHEGTVYINDFTIDRNGVNFMLIPLKEPMLFPFEKRTLVIGRHFSIKAIQKALQTEHKYVIISKQLNPELNNIFPEDINKLGVLARIIEVQDCYPDSYKITFEGMVKISINQINYIDDSFTGNYTYHEEIIDKIKYNALKKSFVIKLNEIKSKADQDPLLDILSELIYIEDPQYFIYSIAYRLIEDGDERMHILHQAILEILESLVCLLQEKIYLFDLELKIDKRTKESIDQKQKEFWVKQKIEVLKKEIGEQNLYQDDVMAIVKSLKKEDFSEEAWKNLHIELKKLQQLSPGTQEYNMTKTYIDWILDIPWTKTIKLNHDLSKVKEQLDDSHYGLNDVKQRILEYVCTNTVNQQISPQILLLLGPPGVGKTSIAISIANALMIPFYLISLAGMSDSSELLGHMRTYIGSMPGKIIHALKKLKCINGSVILDEGDKVNKSHKNPMQTLTAILDLQQNNKFVDHYMNIPVDLSKTLFILTANYLEPIPGEILDRVVIVEVPGYTDVEKFFIMEKIFQKEMEKRLLTQKDVHISDNVKKEMIWKYTKENGVRSLGKLIDRLLSRVLLEKMMKKEQSLITVTKKNLHYYLDQDPYDVSPLRPGIGICRGLAWTYMGGQVLYIEVFTSPGKGKVVLTGNLGTVMKESIDVAINHMKSNYEKLSINPEFFKNHDLYLHVPEGAIPKDGPSAGITIFSAILSQVIQKPIRPDITMTGEISLSGKVLPIGGLKEKFSAAIREPKENILLEEEKDLLNNPKLLKNKKITVIIPAGNTLSKIPKELIDDINIIQISDVTELIQHIFISEE